MRLHMESINKYEDSCGMPMRYLHLSNVFNAGECTPYESLSPPPISEFQSLFPKLDFEPKNNEIEIDFKKNEFTQKIKKKSHPKFQIKVKKRFLIFCQIYFFVKIGRYRKRFRFNNNKKTKTKKKKTEEKKKKKKNTNHG